MSKDNPQPKMIFRKYMDNSDRIIQKMLENMKLDPEVSLRTLLGSNEKVLNLRPNLPEKDVFEQYSTRKNPMAIYDVKPTEKKRLYFKTLEENLIKAHQNAESANYAKMNKNKGILSTRDPRVLKQVLINCDYIQDGNDIKLSKTLRHKSSQIRLENNLNNIKKQLSRTDISLLAYSRENSKKNLERKHSSVCNPPKLPPLPKRHLSPPPIL